MTELNEILNNVDLSNLSKDDLARVARIASEIHKQERQRKIDTFYPETGPLSRANYPKHMEFFQLGAQYRERCMMAANRIGKTEGVGAYEVALHATGEYPDWWCGKRFNKAVKVWVAGDTSKTVRGTVQLKLLGEFGDFGTGMIPGEYLEKWTPKHGIADAVDMASVRHVSGGLSVIEFKSYDQRRESFQGTEIDVLWFDEEPPMDIYSEGLLRTMTTGGTVICTFTPLMGTSEVVKSFIPGHA